MKKQWKQSKAAPRGAGSYSLHAYSDESLRVIASGTNPVMAKVAQDVLDNRKCPYPLHK